MKTAVSQGGLLIFAISVGSKHLSTRNELCHNMCFSSPTEYFVNFFSRGNIIIIIFFIILDDSRHEIKKTAYNFISKMEKIGSKNKKNCFMKSVYISSTSHREQWPRFNVGEDEKCVFCSIEC